MTSMDSINYVNGDATEPEAEGPKLIAHVCNDQGGWGKGFVVAVSARWAASEKAFRAWHRERAGNDFGLGAVQVVQVRQDIWVANMIGQHGIKTRSSGPPVRYDAIDQCLTALAEQARALSATVHMPRIGCGLSGGKWEQIEPLITDRLSAQDIAVTVYDYA